MIKQLHIYLLLLATLFITACEEVGPAINFETEIPTTQDTITNNEVQRTVLLEEFTGVQCANCPAGAELAQQLADASGNRIIIISIHSSGVFSLPYRGEMDFRTTEGDKIEKMLGSATGYPSAAINRKLFNGELNPIVTSTSWSKHIDLELAKTPVIDISISGKLNDNSIEVTCNLNFLEDISNDVKLSVVIVEDEIVSPQNVNSVKIDDYVHQHVFRNMLTPFDGELIATEVKAETTFNKNYLLSSIPGEWNKDKLSVVAFAHGNGTTGVYQVTQTKF